MRADSDKALQRQPCPQCLGHFSLVLTQRNADVALPSSISQMQKWMSSAALAMAILGWSAPASALAVIETTVEDVTCTVTSADGMTMQTLIGCDAAGWSARLEPGWSALLTATISYHYRDDGLPLARQDNPDHYWFQMDNGGRHSLFVTNESAAIYVRTPNYCYKFTGPACPPDDFFYSGSVQFPPVFVSANDRPEDIRGEIPVSAGVIWDPPPFYYGQGFAQQRYLYIETYTQDYSVAAIPEPSTWALMIGPLLGLGFLARRRRGAVLQ